MTAQPLIKLIGVAVPILALSWLVAHIWPQEAAAVSGPATILVATVTALLAWSTWEMASATKSALNIEQRKNFAHPHAINSWGWINPSREDDDGVSIEVENIGNLPCRLQFIFLAWVEWEIEYDPDGYPNYVGVDEGEFGDPLPDEAIRRIPPGGWWEPKAKEVVTIDTSSYGGHDLAGYRVKLIFEGGESCETSVQPQELPHEPEEEG